MKPHHDNLLNSLGFLRVALLALALINILLMLIDVLVPVTTVTEGHSLWWIVTNLVAPVLAPLLVVVLLFDYIMSRVRAADAEGELRSRFITISRIELSVIALSLLFWVPWFVLDLS